MEWVETTGKTVEEAKEVALDELGVLEEDAEFEVLEEPRPGLFGRVRGTARVKARVAPSAPPPKQERRRRNGRGKRGASGKGEEARGRQGGKQRQPSKAEAGGATGTEEPAAAAAGTGGSEDDGGRREGRGRGPRGSEKGGGAQGRKDREMMPENEQREAGEDFLAGLLSAFGYEAEVTSSLDDEGILAFEVRGEQLGLLIGPGLNTLDAVQEVCRNAIQRQADGREYGKVILDVSGARADRTESLEAFVREEAQRVLDSGEDVVFEVMSRGDRKVVHDVVGEFDGLATESVGEDPRRRVVLRPA